MWLLFVVLAAFFKAVSDTTLYHYDTSVFKSLNRKFWDPAESWKYKKYIPFTKYPVDGWHLANSGMIVCFCAAAVLHKPHFNGWLELLAAGTVFNVVFNTFYNHILRK